MSALFWIVTALCVGVGGLIICGVWWLLDWIERRLGLEVAIITCILLGIAGGWVITEACWRLS